VATLTPEFWERIKTCAAAALDLPPEDRDAYIARVFVGDPELGEQVRSLVASSLAATPYFEQPPFRGSLPTLFTAGHRIGPYRIVRELGSGGMGSVYLGERDDGEFLQRAAIKIVRGGFGTGFLLERFREERRILASLEHPNIARLLDGGTTGAGLPYVVMEYVEGEPIDRYCAERRLSLRARLAIFQQVCAAVQYAHQHLVIHRDIKPGNILVTSDGTPKLLDFGIAKLLDSETGLERSTHTTLRVMTPESASPEQVAGKPVSVAADVYALGVLLYRLITGRSPYGATPPEGAELIRAVCEDTPDPPSAHAAAGLSIPVDVDRIVMKALRKEPERRYASAGALSEDAQRFLDGRPVGAAPDSWRYRARKFVSRHGLAVAAAAALIVAVSGGVAATVWQAHVANRERTRAEREFNAVHGIAQAMLGEVHDAVSKLPGSTAAREILLRRGTEYLDKLSAETSGNDALAREVARAYLQLSIAQGTDSASTLGDRETARKSLAKAISLLDTLVRRPQAAADDRIWLATAWGRLAEIQPNTADKRDSLGKARALLDPLTPAEGSTAYAIVARQIVWTQTAQIQAAAQDYAGAEVSEAHFLEAAEEQLRRSPGSLAANYNVSLACKYRGASLEMLKRRPEALALYARALALDQQRVAAEPWREAWRLDLSFSQGSIAAARLADGDLEGGRAGYEQVVATRELVVQQDPHDDFARQALARGYDRLGGVYAELGKAAPAIAYHDKALQVYRDRLDAHPEREMVWSEYANAAYTDVSSTIELKDRFARKDQQTLASWADGVLDRLQAIQHRWTKDGHPGALAPPADQVQAQRAIIARSR
jgi:non-specific serine/threonine protein kinase/serine/threonine-protein kinase